MVVGSVFPGRPRTGPLLRVVFGVRPGAWPSYGVLAFGYFFGVFNKMRRQRGAFSSPFGGLIVASSCPPVKGKGLRHILPALFFGVML